ncbi:MAG: L,D-transpeptidase family protein [Alphaproteobacteria bacterium]|nr:L,D-transpeptidase family protein [Alphaproteobacteria bacterium]
MRGRLAFGPIAGGTIALAAACVFGTAVLAAGPEPGSVFVPARYGSTELGQLLNSEPELVVAGERLNVGLLRRFYALHGFEPVWTTRQAQANLLTNAVLRAGDHGLAPGLFHANLLQQTARLQPLERELLLSDAFLSYADALARGAMPVERRSDDEALTPGPIDVAAVLDAAIDSPDPAAVIEAQAPTTPTYRALRRVLESYRSGIRVGDRATTIRLREIEVNLERQRWLPRRLPPDRVWVNVADARLILYRADRPVFSTRVIVGEDYKRNQSPEFRATIDGIQFNPPWNVPDYIAAEEILPKISYDPNYLRRHNMVMEPNGELQQLPGPASGLGTIKFDMPNRFDVYLHDTPSKNLFSRSDRHISHGCIRVQDPRELAALLMQQPIDMINQAIAMGSTTQSTLPVPVPVFVVYQTAFVDIDGTLQFRPDAYHRDAEIWRRLQTPLMARSRSAELWP